MNSRRSFLQKLLAVTATTSLATEVIARELSAQLKRVSHKNDNEVAHDEDFWFWVQQAYTVDANIINLNNGGVSPQPKVVQDAFMRLNDFANQGPSYYMWRIMDQGREPLRKRLAALAGTGENEIAINRNASEAIETVIFGLNLKAGDEVVLTRQDYPNMIHAWKQREMRDGIKLVWLNLQLPEDDDALLLKQFTEAFSDKTRVVHITHVINWTGQILPVQQIARAAHKRNIEVLVDGAHSFAHLDFKIPDLECDYFGTSLHKWLCAPFGSGLLYVKAEKIKSIWPLLGNGDPQSSDIRKFEVLGTRSFASEQAIGNALDFHNMIGSKRKEERLRFLKNYWSEKVKNLPDIVFNTTNNISKSCAICNINFKGMDVGALESALFSKHKIHTSPINWENIHGVRITPNVYTSLQNLDTLVVALEEIAADRNKEQKK